MASDFRFFPVSTAFCFPFIDIENTGMSSPDAASESPDISSKRRKSAPSAKDAGLGSGGGGGGGVVVGSGGRSFDEPGFRVAL
jgi:hypothetical protein